MIKKERLFTPGPTPLLPEAQAAMAAMGLHHRTAEFRQIFKSTLDRLQSFMQTDNEVLLLASSGTGAMEAAVANLTTPGDHVLVLSAGKFGERWEKLARTFSCVVDLVNLPYGESLTAEHAKSRLGGAHPPVAVFLQASETSTGIKHDVAGIARAVRAASPNTLIVVDAITGLGTQALDIDAWDLDIVIGGSQKATMIPPGLAYLSVSERAWKAMDDSRGTRFYFDLRRERKAQQNGETAFTPATALVAGLNTALGYIETLGGRPGLTANAEFLASATRAAAEALGLKRFGEGQPSGSVTAIEMPDGFDSGVLVKALRQNFGSVIANGQGEMKGKLIRIAHIGYYDFAEALSLIAQIEVVLVQQGLLDSSALGKGVKAAQSVWLASQTVARQQVAVQA